MAETHADGSRSKIETMRILCSVQWHSRRLDWRQAFRQVFNRPSNGWLAFEKRIIFGAQ